VNLFRGKTALLEEAHLAAAFPEVSRRYGTELLFPHLADEFLPLRLAGSNAGLDQCFIDAPLAQLRPDFLRTGPAPAAGMDKRICEARITEQALGTQCGERGRDDGGIVAAGCQFAVQLLFAILATCQTVQRVLPCTGRIGRLLRLQLR